MRSTSRASRAGFLLGGVDYTSARRAQIERQKSTPFELGFEWMVELEREPFVGQAALAQAKSAGPARRFVGLAIDWNDFERIHDSYALPPHIETGTSRDGVPLWRGGRQVGYATSRSWSPLLKEYLALASTRERARRARDRARDRGHLRVRAPPRPGTRPRAPVLRSGAQEDMKGGANKTYDAIVVGGGHNGLVCAAYLAKAGRSVWPG